MDNTKWCDETIWPLNCPIDSNSLLTSKNVLLIHCPMCPYFTFNYKRLLEHLAVSNHSGTLECVFYRCNECTKVSTSSLLLKEHFSDEHSNLATKHSAPISCIGIQRFYDKKPQKPKVESSTSSRCIFCSYEGSDLPSHYSSEHNVHTGPNPLNSILSALSGKSHEPANGDMQMSDGTLIVIPEEPQETHASKPQHSFSQGSRKRKMYPPISSSDTNNTDGIHTEETESSETNSDSFNNQFFSQASNINDILRHDSPNQIDSISASFIDSHMNNVLCSDDEGSDTSSNLSHPLNGDIGCTLSSAYALGSINNRTMPMFGPPMMRKRGRPPKIMSQVLSKEEIEHELEPHIENVGKVDGKTSVRIASGEPYSIVVPLSLLVSAFDTDGVQYLKNLIRFYYKPEQLALFAWDVTQKRGRPRTSITVCADPNSNDVANINLQSLRQQSFVQACMRLIEKLFGHPFPSNLPIFINRLLQSHRFYVYGTTGGSSGALATAPSTNPLVYHEDTRLSPPLGPVPTLSPYRDAEARLARFWLRCDEDPVKKVRLSAGGPSVRKHLLVCAYDADPVRFFRNLVRSALPVDELVHATWKGRNTGRPRFLSAVPPPDDPEEDKRPLVDHPLVKAFLDFVPRVCGRRLPDNLGPIIHQLLATVRKTHSANNGGGGTH